MENSDMESSSSEQWEVLKKQNEKKAEDAEIDNEAESEIDQDEQDSFENLIDSFDDSFQLISDIVDSENESKDDILTDASEKVQLTDLVTGSYQSCKHIRNEKLNKFLDWCLILALTAVFGLGVGNFFGYQNCIQQKCSLKEVQQSGICLSYPYFEKHVCSDEFCTELYGTVCIANFTSSKSKTNSRMNIIFKQKNEPMGMNKNLSSSDAANATNISKATRIYLKTDNELQARMVTSKGKEKRKENDGSELRKASNIPNKDSYKVNKNKNIITSVSNLFNSVLKEIHSIKINYFGNNSNTENIELQLMKLVDSNFPFPALPFTEHEIHKTNALSTESKKLIKTLTKEIEYIIKSVLDLLSTLVAKENNYSENVDTHLNVTNAVFKNFLDQIKVNTIKMNELIVLSTQNKSFKYVNKVYYKMSNIVMESVDKILKMVTKILKSGKPLESKLKKISKKCSEYTQEFNYRFQMYEQKWIHKMSEMKQKYYKKKRNENCKNYKKFQEKKQNLSRKKQTYKYNILKFKNYASMMY